MRSIKSVFPLRDTEREREREREREGGVNRQLKT
jgi:hypothetical protein